MTISHRVALHSQCTYNPSQSPMRSLYSYTPFHFPSEVINPACTDNTRLSLAGLFWARGTMNSDTRSSQTSFHFSFGTLGSNARKWCPGYSFLEGAYPKTVHDDSIINSARELLQNHLVIETYSNNILQSHPITIISTNPPNGIKNSHHQPQAPTITFSMPPSLSYPNTKS